MAEKQTLVVCYDVFNRPIKWQKMLKIDYDFKDLFSLCFNTSFKLPCEISSCR